MDRVRSDRDPVHISGNIWFKQQLFTPRQDGSRMVNVCVKTEAGVLAAIDAVVLNSNGVYTYKDKDIGTIGSPEFEEFLKRFQPLPDYSSLDGRPAPQNEEELYGQVRETYAKTKSIKKTARLVGLSEEKARRILFTTGDYTCETHEKVMALLKEGKSLDEAASAVGLNRHKIRAYLPYVG